MSKPKVVVTEREVRMARAFLAAIGGNAGNGYLLLAVIAWARLMGKAKDPFWKSLSKLTPQRAGALLAARLKKLIAQHPSQYQGMLKALRNKPTSASGMVTQAKSFMLGIEKSGYDNDHYGYREATEGYWTYVTGGRPGDDEYVWVPARQEVDPMLQQWSALTGHPIPPKWFQDASQAQQPPKPKPPLPQQPRGLEHVLPKTDYILPYAAERFYEQRSHIGANILPVD